MAAVRLQKVLAQAGIASRRKAEELILAGRVRVDGIVTRTLGTSCDPRKVRVEVDGRPILREQLCYGVLHKPRGMLTTLSDPEGRPTAHDVLKQLPVRVVPVGRLDFNTSGVLLFTNDGDFVQKMAHAGSGAEKVYAAKVDSRVDERALERWAASIDIDGKKTRPAKVRILRREGDKTWLEVTIIEGRNRQVRRLGEHASTPVIRLARLSHAGISAEGLRPGHFRLLTVDELKTLKATFGVPNKLRGVMESLEGKKPARPPASRPSTSRPSTSRPSTSRPSTSRPSASRSSAARAGASSAGTSPARAKGPSTARPARGPSRSASEDRVSPPERGRASAPRPKKRP